MNILVVDIGGTNCKVWNNAATDGEKFRSGKKLTPGRFIERVKQIAEGWPFDRVSIGYPGNVLNGRPVTDPCNLAPGWVTFDYSNAFRCPLRIMNDACMQALGSYEGGRMLYLGLGTGIGTAFIIDGTIVPLALGHLKFVDGETFDDLLNRKALKRLGKKNWNQAALRAGEVLKEAFLADYVVFGGGNAKRLGGLPAGFRKGGNHNAYFGGVRMWDDAPPEALKLTRVQEHTREIPGGAEPARGGRP